MLANAIRISSGTWTTVSGLDTRSYNHHETLLVALHTLGCALLHEYIFIVLLSEDSKSHSPRCYRYVKYRRIHRLYKVTP